jgi:hypothetical protein
MNGEAWPDGPPELGDVDLEEQPAALVAEALPWDLDGREATCASSPSARRARAALPGKYIPVPEGRHAGSRSIASSETPARASIGASAKPAIPPPTMRTRRPLTTSPTVVHDVVPRDRRRDLADRSAAVEQRRGDRIVGERFRHVRRCLYVPPRVRSTSVTTIPIRGFTVTSPTSCSCARARTAVAAGLGPRRPRRPA